MAAETETRATRPFTGSEYLESLRDDREVWIYGERVQDVTTHPAFRNVARTIAGLYDALHDDARRAILTSNTDDGRGYTHKFFCVPRSSEELLGARDAIAEWQRMVYGWLGRAPDYKAAFLAGLGANPDWYAPYSENALRWYRLAQQKVAYFQHIINHPPVDRNLPVDERGDICVHVEEETDAGLIVSGAKMVATGAALTHYNFIAHTGAVVRRKELALVFILPTNTPGFKLICRPSYEYAARQAGSPFDYPLSSRFDENDSTLILDRVLVPWENVLVYGDGPKASTWVQNSGFLPRAALHASTRLAVKLDFITGLLIKATELASSADFRSVQCQVGEVMAWRNMFWGLSEAMVQSPTRWVGGAVLPNVNYASAYRVLSGIAYTRVKEIIHHAVAGSLMYVNSHAADWRQEELRPYLDRYMRGSKNQKAIDRVKVMKLLWDAIGTEFGGRHELYEQNFSGNHEDVRIQTLQLAAFNGDTLRLKKFVEQCMAEYDIDGWRVAGLADDSAV